MANIGTFPDLYLGGGGGGVQLRGGEAGAV